ncbi:centromere protein J isoform X1 [Hylaeus anthracinus]|uniref:centromere protein J isoform X1 n=2 Tax=Hylaeus anthracinus TaxID=313031 RepID=UPI0023B9C6B9|nr:centromere protein J isoform X1 [Hylaeus anthracinus]
MNVEATIFERLQKLREWQLEQQERLMKQQQMQRDLLTQKQDSMYKALELSLQELDLDETVEHTNNSNKTEITGETDDEDLIRVHNESQKGENHAELINNNESFFQQQLSKKESQEEVISIDSYANEQSIGKVMFDVKTDTSLTLLSPRHGKRIEEFIIDGVAPLPSNKTPIKNICIDDIPVPSPKKDFNTLLEERLKDCGNISCERPNNNSVCKVKRPFLKKGEGLSRFKLNRESLLPRIKSRSRSASFSTSTQSNSKHSTIKPRYNNTTGSSRNTHYTNSPQRQLCLKNVPLPKKKIRSKSESSASIKQSENYINKVKSKVELNTSATHSGTQEEMEEVRIFELLEEKAENSSFCSTSSTVVAFLQQSTPFKKKKGSFSTGNRIVNIQQHTSPVIKSPKSQSVLKSNHAYICTTSNKSNNSYCDLKPLMTQKELHSSLMKNNKMAYSTHKSITPLLDGKENTLLKDQVQSAHNEQNCYDVPNAQNDVDVSLHVRFSEYNEYKTIGLTDSSSISTESLTIQNFCDENAWSDPLTSEVSDTEIMPMALEVPQSPIAIHNNEAEFSDTIDQSPDDEQSILDEYNEKNVTPPNANNFHCIETSRKCIEEYNSREVDNCNNIAVTEDQEIVKTFQETNETIFKSELLKNRLLELEQEINIFRKENAALTVQRKKLQEDQKTLHKEYSEKEKALEESIKQAEDRLQEDRRKLIREKAALENRMRDAQGKAQQSKLERQEIQNLRQELEKLKDEVCIKERRWTAAQSRHKCQVRILKMENLTLKQEIERLQNLKKGNVRNKGKPGTFSNTKAIHQINKKLNVEFKESNNTNNNSPDDSDHKLIKSMMNATGMIDTQSIDDCYETDINEKLQKYQSGMVNVAKKRNLYKNLIKEATFDLTGVQEQPCTSENVTESISGLSNKLKNINSIDNGSEKSNIYIDVPPSNDTNTNSNIQSLVQNENAHFVSPTTMSHEDHNQKSTSSDEILSSGYVTNISSQSSSNIDKQGVRQIQHPDGRIEYWYPNGNVKKVLPDQGLTKLIYYNGDVRETNKNGQVKYYYASTRTWHTTMPDGLEILEFADGQVEKRLHSGTVEVSFPDGSVRILESDGTENWTLPNGTLIQTFTNGEKILTLPNGQREIHTKAHKRREYPDGTVKLIYPDGIQETRYSNGRIRLKDKDGNLLQDSYQ